MTRDRVGAVTKRLLLGRVTTRQQDIFSIAVAAYVMFSMLDCFTTAVALASGRAFERNPFAASIYAAHGLYGLYLLKFVVVAAIIVGLRMLPRHIATWVATAFTAVIALAVVANLQVIVNG
jgi:hypothetical protein